MGGYTLYGAEVSYFTGKARAYLRWRGVPFQELPATQAVYRDLILPNVGWPVIPVMTTPDGEVVQDTADIIAIVEAREKLRPPALPETPVQRFVAELLHLYADEWLTLPAMHYRWSYNEDWAYAEFGALSAPEASRAEQYEIGKKNGQRFKGALPILGVHAETIPGIETSYEAFLAEFSAHLEAHPYLLGARPCLADFAFIGPLYAHLYRDPASGELMKRLAPRVAGWVERTHAGETGTGDLLAGDAIPETLEPILARQMREQFPALVETMRLFEGWAAEASPGTFLPRGLGEIWVEIEGARGPAQARTFPLYRLQAVTDAYDAMDAGARARADALLERVRGAPLKTFRLPKRLVRTNFRLALA
ncbi:glutathione S-transferase N-terminal domain-containing protein [Hyphomonas sp. WL0036]|uniref:glutathione S-transferase N-terminal domain-containing protein n=1 Tax=Hyphomonas sediminis TaxID=2866160 RepID=UPI001C8102E0|nr:glutathione S-transferase N-terminal domain-containing protein [Hyphomonas sediminis]MBY9065466.1 glutathione S-transferase N-terminal domain-containing protein [Hyphomonas sediminis]